MGSEFWSFVVRGASGETVACRHIGQVLVYKLAIRDLQAKCMIGGMAIKPALESATADLDAWTRCFPTLFRMATQG